MRTPTPTTNSPYGTIRAAPPQAPAAHIADAPPRSAPPPNYGPAVVPNSSTPGVAWGTPSYTTYGPTNGYSKVPTSDPSPPTVPPVYPAGSAPTAMPPPELGPSPTVTVSDLVSKFKEQGHALISARRPWPELFHPPAFSRPANIGDAFNRIRRNAAYFRANYIMTILGVLLLGLFYHPFSFFACAVLASCVLVLPLFLKNRSSDNPRPNI